MIEKNVIVVRSRGSSCFVCDKETRAGDLVIQVTLNAPVRDPIFGANLGKIEVIEEMHVRCATDLRSILDKRIKEATGGRGRKES